MKCAKCNATLVGHCRKGCGACTSGYRCPRHGKDWAYRTGAGFFTSGRTGAGSTCRKCGARVVNCAVCKGHEGKSHRACNGTGQVCTRHGGHWT